MTQVAIPSINMKYVEGKPVWLFVAEYTLAVVPYIRVGITDAETVGDATESITDSLPEGSKLLYLTRLSDALETFKVSCDIDAGLEIDKGEKIG